MLSHAAITSRELGKPCIIGIVFGSKALNDGDLIEMDTVNGKINILQKADINKSFFG
jgi:pyruvate,water dikinase